MSLDTYLYGFSALIAAVALGFSLDLRVANGNQHHNQYGCELVAQAALECAWKSGWLNIGALK